MARPASAILTDGELRLMNVLWARGPSTVLEIQRALDVALADSTIRTLLAILEDKRYVRRKRFGRGHTYEAAVDRTRARTRLLRHVVKRFFRSPGDLVVNLLDTTELDAGELEAIRRAIRRRRRS